MSDFDFGLLGLLIAPLLHGHTQARVAGGCSNVLQILHALEDGCVVFLHWLWYFLLHFSDVNYCSIGDNLAA